jgi:hypothetical protein
MKKNTIPLTLSSLLLGIGLAGLGGCGGGDSDTTTDDTTTDTTTTEAGSLVFSSNAYEVLENTTSLTLTVNRIDGSSGSVTVDYATEDDTATAGADYQTALGTLSFADGETSQSFSIPITDDADTEGTENFTVNLSNPTGDATLGSPSSTTVSIIDDESIAVYDFESLTIGQINGQDNWAEAETNATVETDTSSANGTLVVRANATFGGAAGETEISRVNDGSFSFPAFTGTQGLICYDTTADDNSLFALGQEIVADGLLKIDDDEIGVPFGFWERQFIVLVGNSLVTRAGVVDLSSDYGEITDWYRLCLAIDFSANNGDGAGSLSYMNLSRGDTSFIAIPDMQGLNLKLSLNGTPDPSQWNAMFLNLRVDSTDLIPKADNLMPSVY